MLYEAVGVLIDTGGFFPYASAKAICMKIALPQNKADVAGHASALSPGQRVRIDHMRMRCFESVG